MTRTERIYYLVFGLYSMAAWFLAPVYPLYLRSRGLDALEVNLVIATYLIVIFLFEVPTGVVADLFGRKRSFLLSCVIRIVAFVLYYFASDLGDCLVAEVIDGIGTTLATGAMDAWAIDGMRAEGSTRTNDQFFARAQVMVRSVMIGGGLVSSAIAVYDIEIVWLVGAAMFAATFVLGAALMHDAGERVPAARTSFWATARQGFGEVWHEPVLLLVCLLTMASYFAAVPAHMLWQARFVDLSGQGLWVVGWVWVLLNLAALVGGGVLPRLVGRFRREWVLAAAALWRGAFLGVAAAATTFVPALGGWLMQEVSFGVSEPVLAAWTNERISSNRRATVLSVRSMFGTLGGGVGPVALGFVARDHGIPAAWGVSALLFLLAAPAYLLLGRRAGEAMPELLSAAAHAETDPAPKVVPSAAP